MNDGDLLRQLADIEAIKRLKARYFRLMDQKKWDEWAMVFATDAHLVVPEGGVDEHGRAAVVASVSGVLEGVRTVHHGHMPEIELTSATTATGIWAMFDDIDRPDGRRQGFGHYHERYVKGADGAWRIDDVLLTRLREVDRSAGDDQPDDTP
jgi:hypothetical protein